MEINHSGRQRPETITQKVNTTALCYHDSDITTTLILLELGLATVEFPLNKLRKILQFSLQGDSSFNTDNRACLAAEQAGEQGVWSCASGWVSFATEDGREAHFLLLLAITLHSTEVLNLYFGEEELLRL